MQLDEWLKTQSMSQEAFGQLLEPPAPQASVSHWVVGRHLPQMAYIPQISRVTGGAVNIDDFLAAQNAFKNKAAAKPTTEQEAA